MKQPNQARNSNGALVTVNDAMAQLNMCRSATIKLAEEAGALIKFGKRTRININKTIDYVMDEYTVVKQNA